MQTIIEIIEYENESHKVDFKKCEYGLGKNPKKNEILKDFLSFANNLSDDDKYIIIGIKELEDKTKEIVGIEKPTDEAAYRQFINENIEPQINFEYNNVEYNGNSVYYFKIFNNIDRPYLIKKECKNPENGKTELRYGDGFIRIGTSTKKIGRKELDDITRNKLKYIDRHKDLVIQPIIGNPTNEEISKYNVKYLDLRIENISNRSIDFDIEMTIKQSNKYYILTESSFLTEIQNEKDRKKKPQSSFDISIISNRTPIINSAINTKDTDETFSIERNPIRQKFGITIPQNSILSDIFMQCVILLEKNNNKIEAEVIIRSDDFKNGALKKAITFLT